MILFFIHFLRKNIFDGFISTLGAKEPKGQKMVSVIHSHFILYLCRSLSLSLYCTLTRTSLTRTCTILLPQYVPFISQSFFNLASVSSLSLPIPTFSPLPFLPTFSALPVFSYFSLLVISVCLSVCVSFSLSLSPTNRRHVLALFSIDL